MRLQQKANVPAALKIVKPDVLEMACLYERELSQTNPVMPLAMQKTQQRLAEAKESSQ